MSDDFDMVKFIKLMMMSTSSHDHEALVAVRKANAMLAAKNVNWEEFLGIITGAFAAVDEHKSKPRAKKIYDRNLIEPMFDFLDAKRKFNNFVQDVFEFWMENGFLTEKQFESIKRNYERAGGK